MIESMTDYVTRDEFGRIESRVSAVEDEVEGEKKVTRYILEQSRRNGDDIAALKADVAELKSDVGGLKAELRSLRADLPSIVGEVMREVLRERDGS